jgi:hypothetical protein
MPDWTIAMDTGITGRLTHCTVCGCQPTTRWGVCGTEQHTLGYVHRLGICIFCA